MTHEILQGNCLDVLKTLPPESVQCVVTSPPYYGLRDYGVDGQIGLEPTFEEYKCKLIRVFSEVRRVLRNDGTVFLNLGDSYANDAKWGGNSAGKNYTSSLGRMPRAKVSTGFRPKNLMMIPHRIAIALQDAGWNVRQEIIWHKLNPMPESVRDRFTNAHEYIFLLTKSPNYFFDAEAVKESCSAKTNLRVSKSQLEQKRNPRPGIDVRGGNQGNGGIPIVSPKAIFGDSQLKVKNCSSFAHSTIFPVATRNRRSVFSADEYDERDYECLSILESDLAAEDKLQMIKELMSETRSSVLSLASQPNSEAHFATFPEKLIEPFILAGTSEKGACADCGAPYTRIVEKQTDWQERKANGATAGNIGASKNYQNSVHGANNTHHHLGTIANETTGWSKSCACETSETKPCVVLDIFNGSGTTGRVAVKFKRSYVGIEINPEYIEISNRRTSNVQVKLF